MPSAGQALKQLNSVNYTLPDGRVLLDEVAFRDGADPTRRRWPSSAPSAARSPPFATGGVYVNFAGLGDEADELRDAAAHRP